MNKFLSVCLIKFIGILEYVRTLNYELQGYPFFILSLNMRNQAKLKIIRIRKDASWRILWTEYKNQVEDHTENYVPVKQNTEQNQEEHSCLEQNI